jgi:hypothetical protein
VSGLASSVNLDTPMRKRSVKRKAIKKGRIERLGARSARLREELASTDQKIEDIAKRDNNIRTEYANAKRRWGCITQLAAKHGLHRSAVHRIIKRKNVEVPSLSGSEIGPKPRCTREDPKPKEPDATPPLAPGHSKGQRPVAADWIRALNQIRDFAARSSEPRIAQLLDSVIRKMKGVKRGGP